MFAKTLADFRFLVPDRTERIYEQVFRRFHPCAADDEIAAMKIVEGEIVCAAR